MNKGPSTRTKEPVRTHVAVPGNVARTDAAAFARVLARNWEGALLAARSAEPGTGGPRTGRKPASSRKLSFREFAEIAGCHRETVSRYWTAWDRAANAGLVPKAADLSPGQDADLSAVKALPWEAFYFYGTGSGADFQLAADDPMRGVPRVPGRYEIIISFDTVLDQIDYASRHPKARDDDRTIRVRYNNTLALAEDIARLPSRGLEVTEIHLRRTTGANEDPPQPAPSRKLEPAPEAAPPGSSGAPRPGAGPSTPGPVDGRQEMEDPDATEGVTTRPHGSVRVTL
jgi:hypothetical protein